MAWFNPFSWGGGPDQVDYSQLQGIINQIQGQGLGVANNLRNISFNPTAQDQQAYGQSYGFMRDMVMRDLQDRMPGMLAGASNQAGARGMAGSGIEQAVRAAVMRQGQRSAADVLSQYGANQAGIMSQMALNRGQAQVGQNQALWQTILGAYTPQYDFAQGRVKLEEDRIQREQQQFGNMLGKIGGIATKAIIPHIPGMG